MQLLLPHPGRCPSYLSETVQLLADLASRNGLRSASAARHTQPRLQTVFRERAFLLSGPKAWNCFSGPKTWNVLPDRFHSIDLTGSFKKQLRTLLFNHSV